MQFHSTANFLGLAGRDVVGFQLPLRQHGELVLGVEMPAVRAPALRLSAGALALDERSRKHLAQGAEGADETTTQLEFRITGHGGLLHY